MIRLANSVESPIKKIQIRKDEISKNKTGHLVNSFLKVSRPDRHTSKIYSNAHGSGSDSFKHIAITKAITESIERNALYENINNNEHCFALDKTTTGMAALPTLSNLNVRSIALAEAIERFSIVKFNDGLISCVEELSNAEYWVAILKSPFKHYTAILCSKPNDTIGYSYGFAAHKNKKEAIKKAEVELYRNIGILSACKLLKHEHSNITDKRLIFFASEEGYQHFRKLLMTAKSNLNKEDKEVELLVDQEIPHSYSKNVTVWRCLLKNGYITDYENSNFFFF